MTDFSSETCAMLVVIVDVERATCVFVSGSARVVFSQECTLFLSNKTVDPLVEDSIFVIQFVVMGFELRRKSFSCFQLCITWKSLCHVINVVTFFLTLHSSLSLESSLCWIFFFCTYGLKSEHHISNRNDGKELPGQMSQTFGLAELWLFSNLTVLTLAW